MGTTLPDTQKSSIGRRVRWSFFHSRAVLRSYQKEHGLIPQAVIGATLHGATPIRAWREHLQLTQSEVARRLGISQPSYAKQESGTGLRAASFKKIAAALGITTAQLDF